MIFNHFKHRKDCWNDSSWTKDHNKNWKEALHAMNWSESTDAGDITFTITIPEKKTTVTRYKIFEVKFPWKGYGPEVRMPVATAETIAEFMRKYAGLIHLLGQYGLISMK